MNRRAFFAGLLALVGVRHLSKPEFSYHRIAAVDRVAKVVTLEPQEFTGSFKLSEILAGPPCDWNEGVAEQYREMTRDLQAYFDRAYGGRR